MLNKEDILALAWEYSEGSGKRYTFTEENLFAFLEELKKEPAPAQDEQYPPCDYCGVIPDHHPWHGSGMFNGEDSPHIHACNDFRHLLPASPAQAEQQPACGTYTTNSGESLMGIANRELRSSGRWTEIRDLNAHAFPDMGPHDYYPVGTVLRMPAAPIAQDCNSVASASLKTIAPEDVPAYVWGESERRYYVDGYNTAIAKYVAQQANKI